MVHLFRRTAHMDRNRDRRAMTWTTVERKKIENPVVQGRVRSQQAFLFISYAACWLPGYAAASCLFIISKAAASHPSRRGFLFPCCRRDGNHMKGHMSAIHGSANHLVSFVRCSPEPALILPFVFSPLMHSCPLKPIGAAVSLHGLAWRHQWFLMSGHA